MVYPILPQFLMTVLGGNRFHLGIIEGVADSVASVLKLWVGAWSDRVAGRKGFIIFGYALAAVSRPLIGVINAPWQLFLARSADRMGKGIRTSPRDALIADSSDATMRGRAFGFHRAMDHVGAAIGPVLAAGFLWLQPGQLRLLFLLTLAPGLVVVALLVLGLREVGRAETSQQPLRWNWEPFGRPFRLYLLALMVFTLGNSSDAFLLVRATELGTATTMLPVLWLALHIVKSGGNVMVGRLVDRIGPRLPIVAGWLIYAAVYVAMGLATSAWQAWVLFLAYGTFYALTEPAEKVLVANLIGPQRTGLAFGWYNFAIGIAALPSSLIFGALYEGLGPLAAFGWGAGLALAAVILLARVT
jgi:MFS family permease